MSLTLNEKQHVILHAIACANCINRGDLQDIKDLASNYSLFKGSNPFSYHDLLAGNIATLSKKGLIKSQSKNKFGKSVWELTSKGQDIVEPINTRDQLIEYLKYLDQEISKKNWLARLWLKDYKELHGSPESDKEEVVLNI